MARRDSGRLTSSHQIHSRLLGQGAQRLALRFTRQGAQRLALRFMKLAALAALVLGPASGHAARLSEVRVGTHSDHTRIVLELDTAADYRMLSSSKDSELIVALDAQSVARKVPSKSPLVHGVRVEPSATGSTVHIALASPDIQVTEMILSNPSRIVFDLARGDAPATAADAIAPKPEPAAAKTVEAGSAAPGPLVHDAGSAAPGPLVHEAAKPAAAAEAHPAESLSGQLPARSAASDAPVATMPDAMTASSPGASNEKAAEASPGDAKLADAAHPSALATMPAPAPPAPREPEGQALRAMPAAEPAATPAAGASSHRQSPAPSESSESASHWLLGTLMSPTGLVVVGAGLLAGLAMAVMRRRAAADDDPLYSVMSAEDAGGESEKEAAATSTSHWEASEEVTPARDAQVFDAEAEESYEDLPLARLGSPGTPAGAAARSNGSIFDAESSASALAGAAPGAASVGGASHAETLRAAADVDSRIAELERRLEQLAEARERLERQVAAQTEELRVQRAAIARTQRVVRSMTKGEDLVTEPVPRAPNA